MGSGLVAVAAAEGPELGAALDFEGRGPGQPGRAELGSQAGGGLPGQLRVPGGPAGQFGGRGGLLGAGAAGEPRERPPARVQADPEEAADQPGVLGDDAQVGGEHQVDPGADRGAANRGDGRPLQLAAPGEGPVDAAEGGVPPFFRRVAAQLLQLASLGPRAERAAGPADHGGPDGPVAVRRLAGLDELVRQLVVQGVPGRGRVQRDERDALANLKIDHGGSISGQQYLRSAVSTISSGVGVRSRCGPELSASLFRVGGMADVDWNFQLAEQLDWHWREYLRPRLDGLTDAEYRWEPVAGAWNVRPRGTGSAQGQAGRGEFVIDLAMAEPDPPPVTTIAWRLGHLIVDVLGARTAWHFDGPRVEYQTHRYPGDAATALDQLDTAYAAWIGGVRGLG